MIEIFLPPEDIPPSINKIYRAGRFGNLMLTETGLYYKNKLRYEISTSLVYRGTRLGPWLYDVEISINRGPITNRGFIKGKAKDLIKRIDNDGPLKMIQDTLFEVMGIDDRYAMKTSIKKTAKGSEGLRLVIRPLSKKEVIDETQMTEKVLDRWKSISMKPRSSPFSPLWE